VKKRVYATVGHSIQQQKRTYASERDDARRYQMEARGQGRRGPGLEGEVEAVAGDI